MPVQPPPAPPPRRKATDLDQVVQASRSAFLMLAAVSAAINVLMLASPLYMLSVYDRVLSTGRYETLILITAIVGCALLVLGLLDGLRAVISVRVGCWLMDRLGPVFLDSGVKTRLQGDNSGGQGLRDLMQIQNFISSQGMNFLFDAPWTPVFVVLIWLLHPTLGMVALVSALILLGLGIANELTTRKPTTTSNVAQIAAMHQAEITIRNAEVVRAMGMLPNLVTRWRRNNDAASRALRRSSETGGMLVGMTKFVRFFVQIAVLGVGAALVLDGQTTPGVMIAASILLGRALQPVEMAMSGWRNVGTTRIAYQRLLARLHNGPPETERTRLPVPLGYLTMDRVSFGVPGAKSVIVDEVSLAVRPGEAIAVIGPSASGKSTLCRMMVGIVQPIAGEARLDGSELSHWDPVQLGQHIGYLPQDVELFPGTVKDNIARMGESDDEAVVAAAELAQAHEMIQQLPEGYETQIGDATLRLSGGQRHRIGLARAVYGDPKLIVLDEPNANLDQAGEAALSAAIDSLKKRGAALVIVGHRPSTLALADKIVIMKAGRVEAFGPREEILQRMRAAANARPAEPGPVVPRRQPAADGR